MAALAKRLKVTQSTLSNIQSGVRSAGPELLDKIRKLAPGVEGSSVLAAEAIARLPEPASEVRQSLGERLAWGQLERIQELQGLEEALATNVKETARNFDAMDRDDVFIYLSAIKRPLEMDPDETELKTSIANAIRRGGFLFYLRPTKAFLASVGDYVDVHTEFDNFRQSVFTILSADTEAVFRKQLLLIQADGNPLFAVPDFKWQLFYSDRISEPHKAMAGALIAAGHGPHTRGLEIRVPLSTTTTKRILFEVAKTIHLTNPNLKEADRVPAAIVGRLKDSAEFATGEKIDGTRDAV